MKVTALLQDTDVFKKMIAWKYFKSKYGYWAVMNVSGNNYVFLPGINISDKSCM